MNSMESKAKPAKKSQTASSTRGGDASTHVVRVNVLGLAGITVDRAKCRDSGKRKEMPPPPQDMRVVVAFSRSQQIRGTTAVSKPLRRSPNDEIVLIENGSHEVQPRAKSSAAENKMSQRHVAVWTSEEEQALGSLVAFEANLRSSGISKGSVTAASTVYTPMSFEVTAALTEGSDSAAKVALPFGVANLYITGNECPGGETIVLDLPILSTQQANPLAPNKDGLGGCQMIAIRPRDSKSRNKKRGLKRLFARGNGGTKPAKVPSIAERKAFSDAYSTDASGDCVLRVQLQVLEKGMAYKLQKALPTPNSVPPGLEPRVTVEAKGPRDGDNKLKTESSTGLSSREQLVSSDQLDSDQSVSSSEFSCFSSDVDSATLGTNDSFLTDGSRTMGTDGTDTVQTDGSESLLTDASLQSPKLEESSTFATPQAPAKPLDDKRELKRRGEVEDDYTLSFEPHKSTSRFRPNVFHDDLVFIKIFGRELRLPTCGPVITMKNGHVAKFFDDDITHVTGDFFGEDIPIPICSAIKPREDDDTLTLHRNETFSTMSEKGFGDRLRQEVLRTYRLAQGKRENSLDSRLWVPHDSDNDHGSLDAGTLDGTLNGSLAGRHDNTLDEVLGATSDDTLDRTVGKIGLEVVKGKYLTTSPNGTQSNGSVEQETIKPAAKGSPRGVADVEPLLTEDSNEQKSEDSHVSISQKIVDMFRCESHRVDDDIRLYKPSVPALVIPSDVSSIGDLTANTHERKRTAKNVKKSSNLTPSALLPVAFGGNGMCSGVELVEKPGQRGLAVKVAESSDLGRVTSRLREENYFHDYDDSRFRSSSGRQAVRPEEEDRAIELVLEKNPRKAVGDVGQHLETLLQSTSSVPVSRAQSTPKNAPARVQSDTTNLKTNAAHHEVTRSTSKNVTPLVASHTSPHRLTTPKTLSATSDDDLEDLEWV